jgi:hypothetical protein
MVMELIYGRHVTPWFWKPWRLYSPNTYLFRSAALTSRVTVARSMPSERFAAISPLTASYFEQTWSPNYASIDHLLLLDKLAVHIKDRRVLNLISQYLKRTSEWGGNFWDFNKGISLGCPLSPLIGGFFFNAVDTAIMGVGLFYFRFMDDILVLAQNRWLGRWGVVD